MAFETLEFIFKAVTDEAKAKIEAFGSSLKDTATSAANYKVNFGGAQTALHAFQGAAIVATVALAGLGVALKQGIQEYIETEQVLLKAAVAAERTGISFDKLKEAAEGIVNPLVEGEQKLSIISDLVSKGFDPTQAQQLATAMGDLAASGKDAGSTVQEAMLKMTDALVAGKVAGADMMRLFPSLKSVGADSLKALADGSATAAEKQNIFNAVMKDGASAAGALDEYLKKPQGTLEALSVAFADAKEAMAEGFMAAIAPLGDEVTKLMDNFGGLNNVMEVIGATIGGTLVSAFKIGSAAVLAFANTGTILGAIWDSIKVTVLKAIQTIIQGLQDLLGKFTAIEGVADIYASLSAANSDVTLSLKNSNKAFDESSVKVSKVYDEISRLVGGAFEPMNMSLERTPPKLKDVANNFDVLTKAEREAAEEAEKVREAYAKMVVELTKATSLGAVLADNLGLVQASQMIGGLDSAMQSLASEVTEFENAAVNAGIGLGSMLESTQGLQILSTVISDIPPELKKVADESKKLVDVFNLIGSGLLDLAGQVDGTFKVILSAAAAFANDFAAAIEAGLSKLEALGAAGAGALNSITDSLSKSKESKLGGNIGSIVGGIAGISFGPLGTIIGSALGKAVGAFIGSLFAHDWMGEAKDFANSLGIAISAGMQEQLAKLGEELDNTRLAFGLLLNEIADDVGGITKDNFTQFYTATRGLFSMMQEGIMSAAQATEVLNGMFPKLLAAGTDSFGLINSELKELIALSEQFGLEIPEITAFLKEQANVLAGTFDSLIAGISDSEGAAGIADILKGAFEALGGGPEALAQLGPAIDAIKAKLKEMGISMADVGLGFLNQLTLIQKRFPEAVASINAANTAMVALSNMGALTAGRFKTLQDQVTKSFDQINKDGKLSNAELMQIGPTLQLLAQLSLQYGYALSPATIELLKQAGMWDEVANKPKATGDATQTAMDKAATAIEKAALAMESLVDALGAGTTAANGLVGAMQSIPTDLNIGVNFEVGEMPEIGSMNASSMRSFAGLERPLTFDRPEVIKVHSGETLFPSAQNASTPTGSPIYVTHNGDSFDAFVEKLKRAKAMGILESR